MFPKKAKIPAPFVRPSIEVGGHGKVWQQVRAEDVRAGDVIPDFGKVSSILVADGEVWVTAVFYREALRYPLGAIVKIFGPIRDWADN